ncbi:hypothetical protein BU24DRAFT_471647 [Aaosphaeria arxii CBS 175.79]|uniref:BTB domain-containing protein n=1 Tax=Aaosphaeria arxii CBS 175.79 TaxID=1450172 RepID=A0A6A5YAN8_9PLEO|nr:uncharacterized protein BU24DRAFT_471647 [Aaosphaeria arxii CBS 175.79]KAF2022429.1 hypothetical protein BU24DRAFT_471647 [Aaosphaeria arxii CBS 175.79]
MAKHNKNTSKAPSAPLPTKTHDPKQVVFQKLDDLRLMCPSERRGLANGPRVGIYIGDEKIMELPRRAAMAASAVLNTHLRKGMHVTNFRFKNTIPDANAVRFVLGDWLRESCTVAEEVDQIPSADTFSQNLKRLQAARLLGMDRYATHILIYHVDYLKTRLPTYEEILDVIKFRTSNRDPLYTAMINHLGWLLRRKYIPDPEEFESFLQLHDELRQSISKNCAYFEKRRQENVKSHKKN